MTHAPSLVTSSMVKKIVAGPGGYTLPFGGVTNVSDLRSGEILASMKTRRALEWKAWLENPRSMRETVDASRLCQPHAVEPYAKYGLTLHPGLRPGKLERKRDRNRHAAVERDLLGCAEDLGAIHEHEGRIERLDAELARELEARVRGEVIVRVTAGNEEVALWRERNARVVHACDVGRRKALVAEALSERSGRRVERGGEDGVVGVRVAYEVANLARGCEPGPAAVGDEDLAVGEVDKLGHHAALEHVLDYPALRDALGRERDAGALR